MNFLETRFPIRRLLSVLLLTLCAVVLVGCSGDPTPPIELLLSPADFPAQAVNENSREAAETSSEEPAVQVELSGADFTVLESLVLFETANLAQALLSGIKQDQISLGITPQPIEGFEDNSGVIADQLHGEDASTLFFVQGRALVRITLTGPGQPEKLWEIARLARDKSGS